MELTFLDLYNELTIEKTVKNELSIREGIISVSKQSFRSGVWEGLKIGLCISLIISIILNFTMML